MTTETQTTHTPGPWRVSEDRRNVRGMMFGTAYGDATMYPFFVSSDADGFMPAAVFGDGTENRGVAEANARLIAAAPELLAALQTLVRADNTNYERDTMRYEGFFDAARDAIEQATGQRF